MNATQYNVVFPLAKKNEYLANDTVDFILSLENKKLVPGSLAITGECTLQKDINARTPIEQADEVLIDSDAGYHACFRDFVTEFRQIGLTESFSYYPRYVKMKTQATMLQDSLGTETFNCIEGKCMNEVVRKGYNYGAKDQGAGVGAPGIVGQALSFVIKPDIAPNKSNVPVPGNQVGVVRLRCRLAPNGEVVYGADSANSGYILTNLQVRYETIVDDGSREPLTMEIYNVARQVIETNNANLATFVPGLADSVHMSFCATAHEQVDTNNYLECQTIPGKPLSFDAMNSALDQPGGVPNGTRNLENNPNQGASRLYYAVNDTDTALVGFTMQSRSEMLWNYLRSWKNEPDNYAVALRHLIQGKGYGLGINFGAPLDFSNQKFAAEIDSAVANATSVYMYFRGARTF